MIKSYKHDQAWGEDEGGTGGLYFVRWSWKYVRSSAGRRWK